MSSLVSITVPGVRITVAGTLAATAGVSFGPVFGGFGPAFLLAVLVPPVVATAWALLAARHAGARGSARHGALPLRLTGLGVLAVAAAVAATTRPGAAVTSGPSRLLTGALPADPQGPELAAAAAVTGYAALIGCYLVITRRAALAPALPPLLCLLAGLGLGATTTDLPAWYPLIFAILAGLLLATSRTTAGPDPATRGRALVAATVVLAAGTAASIPLTALAPGADAREPADLRSLVAAPVQPKTNTNPFAQYPALREGALSPEITGSASEHVDRLRMVTLSDFNGHTWTAPADYRRAGHQLPPAATTTATREVTLDVSVGTPDVLGWLPTAGRATHISTAGLGIDDNTGDIVIPTGSGTPTSYQVTGTEPIIDHNDVLRYEPAPATLPLTIDLPPDILGFITTASTGQPTSSGQLVALYRALTSPPFGRDDSTRAAGGHGLYQISALLRDKRGTSEQFASAFAVMCRHLGWDARVVLGFRPHWDGGTLTVTGKDVHAWVEVRFNQLGWVPVDPTPARPSPGREPENGSPPPPGPADNPIESVPPQPIPPEPSPDDPSAEPVLGPAITPTGQPIWIALTIIGGVLLTLIALAIPTAKTIRRLRRRRTGTARTRIIAAWREALDALRQTGQRLPSPATTGDVLAVVATGTDCLPALHALAWRTDYVAFAPDEANNADALAAWADSDTIRKVAHHQLRLPARLRAAFNPRPLLTR